jgi:hypothetical protein
MSIKGRRHKCFLEKITIILYYKNEFSHEYFILDYGLSHKALAEQSFSKVDEELLSKY